jgi:hypothetical protein
MQELDNLARIMDILLYRVDRANPQYRDRFPLLCGLLPTHELRGRIPGQRVAQGENVGSGPVGESPANDRAQAGIG